MPKPNPCTFPDCPNAQRYTSTGLCASHYHQKRLTGALRPLARTWAEKDQPCVVCGAALGEAAKGRRYCSGSCQVAASRRRRRGLPAEVSCGCCGETIAMGRKPGGKLRRADTVWCDECLSDPVRLQRFRRYGITQQQYDAAMDAGCAICGARDRKLHVDHDHSCCPQHGGHGPKTCGECVRGLICGPCNRGLGLFGDDPDLLTSAAEYLSKAHLRIRGADIDP